MGKRIRWSSAFDTHSFPSFPDSEYFFGPPRTVMAFGGWERRPEDAAHVSSWPLELLPFYMKRLPQPTSSSQEEGENHIEQSLLWQRSQATDVERKQMLIALCHWEFAILCYTTIHRQWKALFKKDNLHNIIYACTNIFFLYFLLIFICLPPTSLPFSSLYPLLQAPCNQCY